MSVADDKLLSWFSFNEKHPYFILASQSEPINFAEFDYIKFFKFLSDERIWRIIKVLAKYTDYPYEAYTESILAEKTNLSMDDLKLLMDELLEIHFVIKDKINLNGESLTTYRYGVSPLLYLSLLLIREMIEDRRMYEYYIGGCRGKII